MDKSALGYDYKAQTEKHQSQKGDISAVQSCFYPSLAGHCNTWGLIKVFWCVGDCLNFT